MTTSQTRSATQPSPASQDPVATQTLDAGNGHDNRAAHSMAAQTTPETQGVNDGHGKPDTHDQPAVNSEPGQGQIDTQPSSADDQTLTDAHPTPVDRPAFAGHLFDPVLHIAAAMVDDTEKVRIANENRLRSLTTGTKQGRDEDGNLIPDKDGAVRAMGLPDDHPAVKRATAQVNSIHAVETDAAHFLEWAVRQHPLWNRWAKDQKGIGEKQFARLLAAIGDPYWNGPAGRPRILSELWAFCGLHNVPVATGQTHSDTHRSSAGQATGDTQIGTAGQTAIGTHSEPASHGTLDTQRLPADTMGGGPPWSGSQSSDATQDHGQRSIDTQANHAQIAADTHAPTGNGQSTPDTHPASAQIAADTQTESAQAAAATHTPNDPGQSASDTQRNRATPSTMFAMLAARRQRGVRSNWSSDAKSKAFLIAKSMLMQGNRRIYDERRAVTAGRVHAAPCAQCGPRGKPALPGSLWSKAHQNADALRILSKDGVLRPLFQEAERWYLEEGLLT